MAALLIAWEPWRFAAEALTVLSTIGYRGALAAVELAAHGAVAALCAAAGFALWNGAPDARRLAITAVLTSVARGIQSLHFSTLPNNTPPGDEWLVASVAAAVGALALLVIMRATHPR